MSAPDEHALHGGEEEGEMEEMEEAGSDEEDEGVEMDEEGADGEAEKKVYVPGIEPLRPGEELEMDRSAYRMYHECQTGAPCLSFDVVRDGDGEGRQQFPLSMLLCAGTQAETALKNRYREAHGFGFSAVWSDKGQVEVFDLRPQMEAVHSSAAMATFVQQQKEATALFSFSGHMTEGFAIDWSPKVPGRLVSGDCRKNIHVWEPREGGTSWQIDQRPFSSHSKSVEDLQWSPTEATVFASCSVDQSIRIWDIRAPPNSMLSANEAHSSDVNVISWNKSEPFLLSGGDDGLLKVWDLRQFKTGRPVANFKQHCGPITSVEWSPVDSSVFAASGADDVVSQWDLSVESCDVGARVEGVKDLPPQLLFLHQGQSEIKEIHWHPQMPGVMISTALSGFNVFRTISV
uniref:Glutamate-rich WD repeat-containing protein 1 n=1 Tax=Fundulus heteroclitus TaxID=8078 RepID=A0A3Q2PN03_FUNHE